MSVHDYTPHGQYAAPVDPRRCREAVPDGGRAPGFHQCTRRPWKDDRCRQHHPETVAEKRRAQDLAYRRQQYRRDLTAYYADLGRTAEKLTNRHREGMMEAEEVVRRLAAEAADRPEQPR